MERENVTPFSDFTPCFLCQPAVSLCALCSLRGKQLRGLVVAEPQGRLPGTAALVHNDGFHVCFAFFFFGRHVSFCLSCQRLSFVLFSSNPSTESTKVTCDLSLTVLLSLLVAGALPFGFLFQLCAFLSLSGFSCTHALFSLSQLPGSPRRTPLLFHRQAR